MILNLDMNTIHANVIKSLLLLLFILMNISHRSEHPDEKSENVIGCNQKTKGFV